MKIFKRYGVSPMDFIPVEKEVMSIHAKKAIRAPFGYWGGDLHFSNKYAVPYLFYKK